MLATSIDYKLRSPYVSFEGKNISELLEVCKESLSTTNLEVNEKLVNYLTGNAEQPALESIVAYLYIETTGDVARTILNTATFGFTLHDTDGIEFIARRARIVDEETGRPTDLDPEMDGHAVLNASWKNKQIELIEKITETFQWAIDKGLDPTEAYAIVPNGLEKTVLEVSGTISDWAKYIRFRKAQGYRDESITIARALAAVIVAVAAKNDEKMDSIT